MSTEKELTNIIKNSNKKLQKKLVILDSMTVFERQALNSLKFGLISDREYSIIRHSKKKMSRHYYKQIDDLKNIISDALKKRHQLKLGSEKV